MPDRVERLAEVDEEQVRRALFLEASQEDFVNGEELVFSSPALPEATLSLVETDVEVDGKPSRPEGEVELAQAADYRDPPIVPRVGSGSILEQVDYGFTNVRLILILERSIVY